MLVLRWIDIDGSKLCSCFKGGSEMKAFLSKEIRGVALQRRGDNLLALKRGHDLGLNDHVRLVEICYVVAR